MYWQKSGRQLGWSLRLCSAPGHCRHHHIIQHHEPPSSPSLSPSLCDSDGGSCYAVIDVYVALLQFNFPEHAIVGTVVARCTALPVMLLCWQKVLHVAVGSVLPAVAGATGFAVASALSVSSWS